MFSHFNIHVYEPHLSLHVGVALYFLKNIFAACSY